MESEGLLERVSIDSAVCGGMPCVRGTRIPIAIILDGLAEGLSADEIIDHYPQLAPEDVRAALAYAGALARESVWKLPIER
jgi:uncharacterized protein (DUF433 family)